MTRPQFSLPQLSIATKLSLMLLTAALLPLGLTTFHNLQQSLKIVEANEYGKLELLATSTAKWLEQFVEGRKAIVLAVSTRPEVVNFLSTTDSAAQEALRGSVQQTLKNVLDANPNLRLVSLLDRDGVIQATTFNNQGQRFAFREYFREGMQGRMYVSSILIGGSTRQPSVFFSAPVRDRRTQEVVGVALLSVKGEAVWKLLESIRMGKNDYAFLIDRSGVVIGHPDASQLFKSLGTLPPETMAQIVKDRNYGSNTIDSLGLPDLQEAMLGAQRAGTTRYLWQQTPKIAGFAPLNQSPQWVVGIDRRETEFKAPINNLIRQNLIGGLVIGGGTVVLAIAAARTVTRPLRSLAKAAKDLTLDQYDPDALAKIPRGQDDVGQLVDVFGRMAEDINARQSVLQQQVTDLNSQIEVARRAQTHKTADLNYYRQLQQKVKTLRGKS